MGKLSLCLIPKELEVNPMIIFYCSLNRFFYAYIYLVTLGILLLSYHVKIDLEIKTLQTHPRDALRITGHTDSQHASTACVFVSTDLLQTGNNMYIINKKKLCNPETY